MQFSPRTVSAALALTVAASLAVVPALLEPAAATVAPANQAARSSVTAQCAAAQSALAAAKASKAKAHRALVTARKALRKARHSHRPARIRKAKRVLKKARHRYSVRSQNVNTANKQMAYACAAPTSATRANATGQQLDLLATATGALTGVIDATQLAALLDRLLPGASALLSPAQLTALLAGFNTSPLGLDDATALLGGSFSPTELQSILDGTADPALVLALAEEVAGQLSAMTGGVVPVPGSLDPTDLLETVSGMFGTLDPAQLGDLVALLMTAVGQGGNTLDSTQLTTLLDGLVPGSSGLLSPTDLTALLGGVNAGTLDAGTLSNLLGGQFSATQLQSVIDGSAGPDLVGQVVADVIAQLGTIGGGDLTLPGSVDPGTLATLVSTVTTLVTDVVTSVVTTIGNTVCTLLPILC